MKKIFIPFILILSLSLSPLFAQGNAILPVMLISPAPGLNARAGAYTALATGDPYGVFFNPAQLGNFGRENNAAFQFYTRKTDWLPNLGFDNFTLNSRIVALGYDLEHLLDGLPLSIGLAYYGTTLDLGTNYVVNNDGNIIKRFEAADSYDAYAVGIGIDYFLRLNVGYTFKNAVSKAYPQNQEARVYDLGLQLALPLMAMRDEPYMVFEDQSFFFDFALGLARVNRGDKVTVDGREIPARLPEQARMGYGFSLGLNGTLNNRPLQTLKLEWSTEARDELSHGEGFTGAINIRDHLILEKSSREISIYSGWSAELLETLSFSAGHFRGGGFDLTKTRGLAINSAGLFRAADYLFGWRLPEMFIRHVTLRYYYTWYATDGDSPLDGTTFSGINLSIHGF